MTTVSSQLSASSPLSPVVLWFQDEPTGSLVNLATESICKAGANLKRFLKAQGAPHIKATMSERLRAIKQTKERPNSEAAGYRIVMGKSGRMHLFCTSGDTCQYLLL